jgi:Skp family chaperone for outer membrane proteins
VTTPAFLFSAVGSKVDREQGVLIGVSVITEGIAKGHGVEIDQTTLEQVKACADAFPDGVQVKVNHGTGFDAIVGTLRNFRLEGSKLLADLHLIKNHKLREQILDVAELMPASVGLSIAFSGKPEKGKARCVELYSVDFVDRPAANPSGLFRDVDSPPKVMDSKSLLTRFKDFFSQIEKEVEPTNFEAKATELEAKLSEANVKLTEFAALQAKFTELEAAKKQMETEFAVKVADFDSKVEKAAGEKSAAIMASMGVPPVNTSTSNATKLEFSALVQAQVAKGLSKAEAVAYCVKTNPAEYAEWRKSGKTQTL